MITTGTLLFYSGAILLGVAAVVGIPVMLFLRWLNHRVKDQIKNNYQ